MTQPTITCHRCLRPAGCPEWEAVAMGWTPIAGPAVGRWWICPDCRAHRDSVEAEREVTKAGHYSRSIATKDTHARPK